MLTRLVVAICVVPAVVVGLEVSAAAEIAVLVAVLIAGIVFERPCGRARPLAEAEGAM